MVTRYSQIGIVSAGEDCFDPEDRRLGSLIKHPGVYTRMTEFKDWILKNAPDTKAYNC